MRDFYQNLFALKANKMPRAGLEPARINRAILSRLRLPVPPPRLKAYAVIH